MNHIHTPPSTAVEKPKAEESVAPHGSDGITVDPAHFHNHAGLYIAIGGVLMVGTGLTVAASYFDFGSKEANIIVAMIIATVKASLVAAIFMHLKEEKATIGQTLVMSAIAVTGLFLLSILAYTDHIHL